MLKVWSNDDPHPQEEYLDCLWIQIKKLEDNDWTETQLHRPYTAFETLLATATPHEFPTIYVPEHEANAIFPLPRVIYRMFDYTDVPEEYILPGSHSVERYLIEEQLHSVINTYYLERKLCATRLLSTNITNKIPLNYMIVEVCFRSFLFGSHCKSKVSSFLFFRLSSLNSLLCPNRRISSYFMALS